MYSKVYLEITNVCNKNCSFCPGVKRAPKTLSEQEFDYITDKLIGVTEYLYLHVMGEPLLCENVGRFVKIATDKGFKVAITTNGTLLSQKGNEIIQNGVYKVNISVHSFEDGTQNEYENYLKDCIAFANEATQNGVLTVFRLWNNGCDNGLNDKTIRILKQIKGEWKEGRRGVRIKDKLHLEFGERFIWPDTENERGNDSVYCYGLKDQFAILSNGTIIPCCLDREGVINLGNIFYDDLNTVLSSKRATAIREGFKNRKAVEDLCQKCPYARRF